MPAPIVPRPTTPTVANSRAIGSLPRRRPAAPLRQAASSHRSAHGPGARQHITPGGLVRGSVRGAAGRAGWNHEHRREGRPVGPRRGRHPRAARLGALWWSLSGGWDGIRPAAHPEDRDVVDAREACHRRSPPSPTPPPPPWPSWPPTSAATRSTGARRARTTGRPRTAGRCRAPRPRSPAGRWPARPRRRLDATAADVDARLRSLGWVPTSYGEMSSSPPVRPPEGPVRAPRRPGRHARGRGRRHRARPTLRSSAATAPPTRTATPSRCSTRSRRRRRSRRWPWSSAPTSRTADIRRRAEHHGLVEQSTQVEVEAPVERVWDVLQTSSGGRSGPHGDPVRRLDDGPLAVGSRARVEQPRIPPTEYVVTELDPGRSFTWVATGPGVRTTARHVLEPLDVGRTRVTLSVEQSRGWLGSVMGRFYRGLTDRYLAVEAAGIGARARAGSDSSVPSVAVGSPGRPARSPRRACRSCAHPGSRPTAARRPPGRGGRAGQPRAPRPAARTRPCRPRRRTRTGSRRGTPAPAGARGRAATPARPTPAGRRPGRSPGCRLRARPGRSGRDGRRPRPRCRARRRRAPAPGRRRATRRARRRATPGTATGRATRRAATRRRRRAGGPAHPPHRRARSTPRSSGATTRPGTRACAVVHQRSPSHPSGAVQPPSGAASGRTTGAPDAVQPGGPGGTSSARSRAPGPSGSTRSTAASVTKRASSWSAGTSPVEPNAAAAASPSGPRPCASTEAATRTSCETGCTSRP